MTSPDLTDPQEWAKYAPSDAMVILISEATQYISTTLLMAEAMTTNPKQRLRKDDLLKIMSNLSIQGGTLLQEFAAVRPYIEALHKAETQSKGNQSEQ